MTWFSGLILMPLVALINGEDYTCPRGGSSRTITINDGNFFTFNSNPNNANMYQSNMKCLVNYKRGNSCLQIKFECESFNVHNRDGARCMRGDKLIIGRRKAYCQKMTVRRTTKGGFLKIRFLSNRSRNQSGAQCTIQCVKSATTSPPVTTSGTVL